MSDQQIRGYLALFIAGVLAFGLWVVIDSEEATNEKIAKCKAENSHTIEIHLSHSETKFACLPMEFTHGM